MSLLFNQSKLLLGLILAVVVFVGEADDRGFLLVAPSTLYMNTNETVCLTLYNANAMDDIVNIKLSVNGSIILAQAFSIRGNRTCLKLLIPSTSSSSGKIIINGTIHSLIYKFNGEANVVIRRHPVITFIETDKKVYKSGQTVQFRIFRLTKQLEPVLKPPISEVWIENPSGVRLRQWREPKIRTGLTDLSFELSEEPQLGEWSICLENMSGYKETRTFQVIEYVLPKFEVIITTEPTILISDFKSFHLKICAYYTYGRPVHGRLNVGARVDMNLGSSPFLLHNTSFDLVRGCQEMLLFRDNFTAENSVCQSEFSEEYFDCLPLQPIEEYWASITYFSEVIENGTEVKIKTSKSQQLFPERLQFEFKSNTYFKPNMTYFGKVLVQHRNGTPAANELIKVRVTCKKIKHLGQYLSNNLGEVNFNFVFKGSDPYSIMLQELTGSKMSRFDKTLKSWYSPKGRFLQIEPLFNRKFGCVGSKFDLFVNFTITAQDQKSDHQLTFYCQMMAKGSLLSLQSQIVRAPSWQDKDEPIIHNITIPISISPEMSPLSHIIVYYVAKDGEIVSDSQELPNERCTQNNVTLSFDKDEILPSETTVIQITAYNKSLCALSVVDKSAQLLSLTKFLDIERVYAAINNVYPKRDLSINVKQECDDGYEENTRYVKTSSAFNDVGLITISKFAVNKPACSKKTHSISVSSVQIRDREPDMFDALTVDDIIQLDDVTTIAKPPPVPEIRDYFPETWLWELHRARDGAIKLNHTLPHSITTWIGTTFCLSNTKGFGISQEVSIRGFQAFFLSLDMPFAVKNEEVTPIIVTIFSYLSKCMPVTIFIEDSDKYSLIYNSSSVHVCLCSLPHTHTFWVRPSFIGSINVTIYAHSANNSSTRICELEDQVANVNARDAVTNQLLVKAQGFPKEVSNTLWICPRGKIFSQYFPVLPPKNVIRGSERASVSFVGDIMGPSIHGLESLVKLPVGCGEQNMVLFAPNIYVLQYLTNSKQLADDVKGKLIDHLVTGYQRQLNYKHQDGSYSAFGKSDSSGSIWLTAFVLKSFAQAKPFIYLDQRELDNCESFIYSKQLSDGSFSATGKVLSKAMQGGIGSDTSDQSLAAYILICLLEAGSEPNSLSINFAFKYLLSHNPTLDSMYLLAMKAYAAALGKRSYIATFLLELLYHQATRKGDMLYWTMSDSQISHAVDIEITSYALLTLLTQSLDERKGDALSIVRWLTKQRNSYGGFVSTQDTILALQALAKYAGLVVIDNISLKIELDSKYMENVVLEVNNDNKLVQQTKNIDMLPTTLYVRVTGKGCVMLQLALKYNILNNRSTEAFNLDVFVKPAQAACSTRQLEICASYKLADSYSNMAVIEVQMISGFEPETKSLDVLQNSAVVQLKRWEISPEGLTNLYFEELSKEKICFGFNVIEKYKVDEVKPAIVQVYDYYEPELAVSTSYSFSEDGFCNQDLKA